MAMRTVGDYAVRGGFLRLYDGSGYPLQTFGLPLGERVLAQVTDVDPSGDDARAVTRERWVQFFERAIFIAEPENAPPWDAVCALTTQLVSVGGRS